MALYSPLYLQAATGDTPVPYSATDFRRLLAAIAPTPGVTRKNDLKVSQRSAGANMTVDVAAGSCIVDGTTLANQGNYFCVSDAVFSVTISPAPGSGTRIDRIVAQVYDNQSDGLGLTSWTPKAVTGVVGGGAPAEPDNATTLAFVTVSAGVASIVNGNIDDSPRLLNLLVDKPQWQLGGGNGQAIADSTSVTYRGWSYDNRIGVDTNANPGEVVLRQGGQYAVSITCRLDKGGTTTAERLVWVDRLNSSGVFQERVGASSQFPAALGANAGPAVTGSGTVVCNAGDILRAKVRHGAGVTLHIYDADNEARFTGGLVGPA